LGKSTIDIGKNKEGRLKGREDKNEESGMDDLACGRGHTFLL
jgi:hypothetical protein